MAHASMENAAPRQLLELVARLEQQEGFSQVVDSLQAGQGATLDGVWGSACALAAAALAEHAPGPLVIICPGLDDADGLIDDLALFSAFTPERFPAWESLPSERVVHDEVFGERLRLLKLLQSAEPPRLLIAPIQALVQPVPDQQALARQTRSLRVGAHLPLEELTGWLAENRFHNTTAVELPGEFSVRGGIVDIFAPDWYDPVRVELAGDEIESIRRFEVASQRSLASLPAIDVTILEPNRRDRAHLADYLPPASWLLLIEPGDLQAAARHYLERLDRPQDFHDAAAILQAAVRFPTATVSALATDSLETTCRLRTESVERFSGDVEKVRDQLDEAGAGQDVFLVCQTEAEVRRLAELFDNTRLAAAGHLHYRIGNLQAGFRLCGDCPDFRAADRLGTVPISTAALLGKPAVAPDSPPAVAPDSLPAVAPDSLPAVAPPIVLLSSRELFHRAEPRRAPARRRLGRVIDSFLELRVDDLVVHVTHGIARYRGLKLLEKHGRVEEFLELEFHGQTKLYVPASKIGLVQKYVGGTKSRPMLAKIGGRMWTRQKERVQAAVTDMAADMLDLQAARAARPGISFSADTEWQREFDAAFPYHETPDQVLAIEAIQRDMAQPRPMDRLLCGDVGYGKTEVAMRAAFKAVDAGYQVAVLVPTTVLAEQHLRTFTERMGEFPFEIAALSRFATRKQQMEILARLAAGSLDIVIGTHRLAQADVQFHNLGLVIIDEEQRFGVEVKERLKAFRQIVDVLTMTATPIPRTLHMGLMGLRDISNLETPP
ncbi:MAG: DEAD/DEAH box helicase [Thermoguttaceae bacterium]